MSIAIVETKNTMGVRTLTGYQISQVERGPAEPGPRMANNPVHGHGMRGMGAAARVINQVVRPTSPLAMQPHRTYFSTGDDPNVVPYSAPPATSNPPQNPTGSAVSSYTELSQAINPAVANTVAPAANPTSVASVAPASSSGYVVVQSGATNPDYFTDITGYLESNSLLASLSASLNVPNWIPIGVVALGVLYMMSGKRR